MKPCPDWIYEFLYCTLIPVILDLDHYPDPDHLEEFILAWKKVFIAFGILSI